VVYPFYIPPGLYGIRYFCVGLERECVHAEYLCVSKLVDLNWSLV